MKAIWQVNAFSSASIDDNNYLPFSLEDYPAINGSFIFQDILGKDSVGLVVLC